MDIVPCKLWVPNDVQPKDWMPATEWDLWVSSGMVSFPWSSKCHPSLWDLFPKSEPDPLFSMICMASGKMAELGFLSLSSSPLTWPGHGLSVSLKDPVVVEWIPLGAGGALGGKIRSWEENHRVSKDPSSVCVSLFKIEIASPPQMTFPIFPSLPLGWYPRDATVTEPSRGRRCTCQESMPVPLQVWVLCRSEMWEASGGFLQAGVYIGVSQRHKRVGLLPCPDKV